jgi:hypothetical protein
MEEKFPMMEFLILKSDGFVYYAFANFYNYLVNVYQHSHINYVNLFSRVHFINREEILISERFPLERVKLSIKQIQNKGRFNFQFVNDHSYDDKIKELMIH